MTMKGALVAAGVAGLFAATVPLAAHADAKGGGVMCKGANECKGKGECKGGENGCKGKNSCKGKGISSVKTEKDCTDKKGTVVKG
jgi:hypothetical protein